MIASTASDDELLALLQRGRGRGLQLAASLPAERVRRVLLHCLHHDPRWDDVMDSLGLYYADVAAACGLDAVAVHGALQKVVVGFMMDLIGVGAPLVLAEMLGVMAVRGDAVARDALRKEVLEGRAWLNAADVLALRLPAEAWMDLGTPLFDRLPDDAVAEMAGYNLRGEPWSAWKKSVPRFKRAITNLRRRQSRARAKGRSATDHEPIVQPILLAPLERKVDSLLGGRTLPTPDQTLILQIVARAGDPSARSLAFLGLARLGDTTVLDVAVPLALESNRQHLNAAAEAYVCAAQGSATLPDARVNLDHPGAQGRLARLVLSRWAEPQDEPYLRDALASALEADDPEAARLAVDGLSRFDATNTVPELEDVYTNATQACLRASAAYALARVQIDFAATTAIECLYDCDAETRLLGIELADRSIAGVEDRIRAMADDPAEEPPCRAAALRSQ